MELWVPRDLSNSTSLDSYGNRWRKSSPTGRREPTTKSLLPSTNVMRCSWSMSSNTGTATCRTNFASPATDSVLANGAHDRGRGTESVPCQKQHYRSSRRLDFSGTRSAQGAETRHDDRRAELARCLRESGSTSGPAAHWTAPQSDPVRTIPILTIPALGFDPRLRAQIVPVSRGDFQCPSPLTLW